MKISGSVGRFPSVGAAWRSLGLKGRHYSDHQLPLGWLGLTALLSLVAKTCACQQLIDDLNGREESRVHITQPSFDFIVVSLAGGGTRGGRAEGAARGGAEPGARVGNLRTALVVCFEPDAPILMGYLS